MGLDMYLKRAKHCDEYVTGHQLAVLDTYFDWEKECKTSSSPVSFEEWCGRTEEDLPSKEVIEFYRKEYRPRYHVWDTSRSYPSDTIFDYVGYWRKANQIHNWFVENVQDGEDDCGTYHVSTELLESLLDDCIAVIQDPSKAKELLPTCAGFFFGNTDYDEYYFEDLKKTVTLIRKLLDKNKSGKYEFYYSSSW